jgi:hypothetical protein
MNDGKGFVIDGAMARGVYRGSRPTTSGSSVIGGKERLRSVSEMTVVAWNEETLSDDVVANRWLEIDY